LKQSLWIRTYKFYYFDSFLVHLLKYLSLTLFFTLFLYCFGFRVNIYFFFVNYSCPITCQSNGCLSNMHGKCFAHKSNLLWEVILSYIIVLFYKHRVYLNVKLDYGLNNGKFYRTPNIFECIGTPNPLNKLFFEQKYYFLSYIIIMIKSYSSKA